MNTQKECVYCRTLCDHIAKEFHIPVQPPELLALITDSQKQQVELTKTLQALRTTYTNTNAFMMKEKLVVQFEKGLCETESRQLESEIAGLVNEIEALRRALGEGSEEAEDAQDGED